MSLIRSLARRRHLAIALAAVALLASAGAAFAIGAVTSTTVIHACYKTAAPNTLSVRTASTCPSGTTGLSWSQQGPQGLQGKQGIQGIQGIQGEQGVPGAPGLSGFHTVVQSTGVVPAGNLGAIDVSCASGETAISGGADVPYTATVLESHPNSANPAVWTVAAAFPSVDGVITVYVQCVQLTAASAAARSAAEHAPARSKVTITPLRR